MQIDKKLWDTQVAEELAEESFAVSVDHRGYFTNNQINPLFIEDASPTPIWVDIESDGCADRIYFDDVITAAEYYREHEEKDATEHIGIFDHGKMVTGNMLEVRR
jgi:hypothetical protein